MAGASRGPSTAASSTTAPPRVPTARPGASERSSSGGTTATRNGRAATCPTSRKTRRPITAAAKTRRRRRRSRGDKPFIMHPDGVGWIWVPSGLKDGPLPDALRAARVAVSQRALSGAADQSGRRRQDRPENRVCRFARRAFPLRAHDVPPDRASHGRRHVAHALASRRAAAGAFLRNLAGARRGRAIEPRRLGDRSRRRAASSRRACWSPRACTR